MIFKLKILYFYLLTKYGRRFIDREQLMGWQQKKITRHLKWVIKHSPFYRSHFKNLNLSQWQKAPIIDKTMMMNHFSELNTKMIDRDEAFKVALQAEQSRDFSSMIDGITIGLSSGTSGNRGLFLASNHERARHAGTILAKILPNSLLSKNRVAFFMRANSNLYTASRSRRLQFEFFDLFQPLGLQLERLQKLNPTLLFAPPSLLLELAKAQKSNQLNINPLRIFSIAETLDPLDQFHIEKEFKQKVHQIYQCTEGFLGTTCKEGTLHLNEDCVNIEPEWIDQDNRKFIPIVTDFTRTTQPILRYRLNDILTERRTPCPCGSPFRTLDFIEGRSDDLIQFPKNVTVFPDFIRRAIITAHPSLDEYFVLQDTIDELKIHLKSDQFLDVQKAVKINIEKLASDVNSTTPGLQFFDFIPERSQKKLRRVMRTVPMPSDAPD